MYEYWCEYAKPKYGDKKNLCYTDTDRFIIPEDVYTDLVEHFETRFEPSNYEVDRPLPIGKNRK